MELSGWLLGALEAGRRTIVDGLRAVEEHLGDADLNRSSDGGGGGDTDLEDTVVTVHPDGPNSGGGEMMSTLDHVNSDTDNSTEDTRAHVLELALLVVDDDVRAMAAGLATGPVAAFLAVAPLASVNKFTLTPAQQAHALQVLDASSELARFRYEITKFELSDAAFWGLYFRHLERLRRSRPAPGPRARAGADAQAASSAIPTAVERTVSPAAASVAAEYERITDRDLAESTVVTVATTRSGGQTAVDTSPSDDWLIVDEVMALPVAIRASS